MVPGTRSALDRAEPMAQHLGRKPSGRWGLWGSLNPKRWLQAPLPFFHASDSLGSVNKRPLIDIEFRVCAARPASQIISISFCPLNDGRSGGRVVGWSGGRWVGRSYTLPTSFIFRLKQKQRQRHSGQFNSLVNCPPGSSALYQRPK